MSIKVQVTGASIDERSGVSAKTGKAWSMRTQEAWAYCPDKEGVLPPFPAKFEIMLDDGQVPYVAGVYELLDSSFHVVGDSYGHSRLEVSVPRLGAKVAPVAAPRA